MHINRRRALGLAAGAAALGASRRLIVPAEAQAAERHGMSAFGDLALPADFAQFPYVNANAPKGGTYSEVISSRGYNGSFLSSLFAPVLMEDPVAHSSELAAGRR